jgi:hypothetical protein
MRRWGKRILIGVGVLIAASALLSLTLLITGHRLLVREHRVDPGETFHVDSYGNLGDNSQASLVCWYFTGRSVLTRVLWYSPNNILGRDSCPFLLGQD